MVWSSAAISESPTGSVGSGSVGSGSVGSGSVGSGSVGSGSVGSGSVGSGSVGSGSVGSGSVGSGSVGSGSVGSGLGFGGFGLGAAVGHELGVYVEQAAVGVEEVLARGDALVAGFDVGVGGGAGERLGLGRGLGGRSVGAAAGHYPGVDAEGASVCVEQRLLKRNGLVERRNFRVSDGLGRLGLGRLGLGRLGLGRLGLGRLGSGLGSGVGLSWFSRLGSGVGLDGLGGLGLGLRSIGSVSAQPSGTSSVSTLNRQR